MSPGKERGICDGYSVERITYKIVLKPILRSLFIGIKLN